MKTLFKVTIKIDNPGWDYKKDDKIEIPVFTSNRANAAKMIDNRYTGSEYPGYRIVEIEEYDKFLFKPIVSP